MIIQSPEKRNDFKQLIQQHKNKLIVVKFYADWCRPCQAIKDNVHNLFEQINRPKLLINVNVDEQDDVASYMKVNTLPTIVTYKNGERDQVFMGGNVNELSNFLKNL
jgi:thioredoxin 1